MFQLNHPDLEPEKLVVQIFETMRATKKACLRYCSRVMPFQIVTSAKLAKIVEGAKTVIDKAFQGESKKFAIAFRKCMNTCVDRTQTITQIGALVNSRHKVDLGAPDLTIIVQCVKGLCGLAVSSQYHLLAKFNVNSMLKEFTNAGSQKPGKVTPSDAREPSKGETTSGDGEAG